MIPNALNMVTSCKCKDTNECISHVRCLYIDSFLLQFIQIQYNTLRCHFCFRFLQPFGLPPCAFKVFGLQGHYFQITLQSLILLWHNRCGYYGLVECIALARRLLFSKVG